MIINFIYKNVKKLISTAIIIYTYNMLALPINVIIPINWFNLILVFLFGLPALFGLIFFFFLF